MAVLSEKVQREIESLKTLRDDLRVQANLGAKEARDLWHEAERKWGHVESKLESLGEASVEPGREVGAALEQLAESLRDAYTKFKSRL